MQRGDKVRATWTDGLVIVGKYDRIERGYVILLDDSGKRIVCNPDVVEFELVNIKEE